MSEAARYSGDHPSELMHEELDLLNKDTKINVSLKRADAQYHGYVLHWHEFLEFYYVKKGGVRLLCSGHKQWLQPGDAAFVNWCQPHRGTEFLENTEYYIIQVSPAVFADEVIAKNSCEAKPEKSQNLLMTLISGECSIPAVFRRQRELTEYLDCIIRESEEKAAGYELKCKAAVLNILTFLIRRGMTGPKQPGVFTKDLPSLQYLKKILVYLSFHYTNPEEVTLAAVSRQIGLSAPYICRIFKKYTALTLTAYVNELRCTRASALIRNGVPLERAAEQTGFHDYNYFSRTFKKVTGMAPSAFRDASSHTENQQSINSDRLLIDC